MCGHWTTGVVIDLLCDLFNCCVVLEQKEKNVYGNTKVAAKIFPLLKLYVTLKWNEMFYLVSNNICHSSLPGLFVSLFVFAVVFVFVFFYHYFTLFYFVIFLYFTTHIFVTLIKDYKIYLVAKRPRQAC